MFFTEGSRAREGRKRLDLWPDRVASAADPKFALAHAEHVAAAIARVATITNKKEALQLLRDAGQPARMQFSHSQLVSQYVQWQATEFLKSLPVVDEEVVDPTAAGSGALGGGPGRGRGRGSGGGRGIYINIYIVINEQLATEMTCAVANCFRQKSVFFVGVRCKVDPGALSTGPAREMLHKPTTIGRPILSPFRGGC